MSNKPVKVPSLQEVRRQNLINAEKKRIEKLRYSREVYGYRRLGEMTLTDNMLLLPSSEKMAHRPFVIAQLKSMPLELLEKMKDVSIVHIARFNVYNYKYEECPHSVLVHVSDVYDEMKKEKENEIPHEV